MYYSHFGLEQAPFKITPDTEFFFAGGNRGPILEALIYAVSQGEGIVKVTGEVGSGKTMLCSMLQARLPGHIESVYLPNPNVSPDEILHAIAFELQLGAERGASKLEVMHALHEFLLERHAEGKRVVVFVEESQGMPLETLEQIRLLSNLETRTDKLLQIVLFGQPEFDANLREPGIRQLRERITHSFRLDPLAPGEIREYLMFRMRAAGYRGPDLFSRSVVKAIARASEGLTRRVNIIADKALLAAFSENTHTIKLKHVADAVRDSEFSRDLPAPTGRVRWAVAVVLVAAGAVAGASLYGLLRKPDNPALLAGTSVAPAGPAASAQVPKTEPEPRPSGEQPTRQPSEDTSAPTRAPETPQGDLKKADKSEVYSSVPGVGAGVTAPTTSETVAASSNHASPLPTTVPSPHRGEEAKAAPTDLLTHRLEATTEWLAREAEGTYSIQLFGAWDETNLTNRLKEITKFVEINDIFVYRTVAKKQPSLTVLYGRFSDRQTAREALARLPAFLKAYQPILRTVHGIKEELRQVHGS